jgi:hypothetical protein
VIKTNESLGASFELPDRLTVDQLDEYQCIIGAHLKDYEDAFLSAIRFRAIVYGAAVEAGLIGNWRCDAMPDMQQPTDAMVISWVGQVIQEYVSAYTTISPN